MSAEGSAQARFARVLELLELLEAAPSTETAATRELVAQLLALHEQGMKRVIALLPAAERARLGEDPELLPLLMLHGMERERAELIPLERLTRKAARGARCELCGAELSGRHEHLVEREARALLCACLACAVCFPGTPGARYRRVEPRVERVELRLDDASFARLGLPVDLVILRVDPRTGEAIALYPGPAGVTESPLGAGAWRALVEEQPVLGTLDAEIEALLIGKGGAERVAYRTSLDYCYELSGMLRRDWHGFAGGSEARRKLASFFDKLRAVTAGGKAVAHAC